MNTGTEQQTPVFTGIQNQSSPVQSAPEPLVVPSGASRNQSMTSDEALLEVAWVAREAREIVAATPDTDSTDEYWAAWQARWDAYMVRKDALLAYIESTNRKA